MQLREVSRTSRRPLRIYTAVGGGTHSWIDKYRLLLPLYWGDQLGYCQYVNDKKELPSNPSQRKEYEELVTAVKLVADVHWYHHKVEPAVEQLLSMKERGAVVWGSDDDLENIDPFNTTFQTFGTTDGRGNKLKPGEPVMFSHNGQERVLWEDGQTMDRTGVVWSLEDANRRIDMLRRIASEVEGVVVSTPELANVYRRYGAKNIYVYPNSLDAEDYPDIDLAPPSKIRILWAGGSSHLGDLSTIEAPLRAVLARHPEVEFLQWGQIFEGMRDWLDGRVTFMEWVHPEAYTLRLSTINHVINLCPLAETAFNESKSAIKWYESSMICRPAATLAAAVGPFKEICDGTNGLLYRTPEEFAEKLEALIASEALRQRLAHEAKRWVLEHRDVHRNAGPLFEWMHETAKMAPRNRKLVVAR
jgi:hypothetical protein